MIAAWTKAEAYRVQTLDVVTRTVQGRPPGAETSFVKLWWSELDIELHELALDLLGPDAELESGWSKGWQFSLSGPIYAGTNEIQRNIAAERVLGLPALMHFAFDEEQLAFRDAVRDLLAKHCPPEVVRAAWDAAPGSLDRGAWTALAEMGVLTVLVPDDIGGLGLDERSLVLLLEEAGYAGLPHPLVESAAVAMPLADDRLSGSELVATDLAGPHVCCAADADHLLLQTTSGALHLVPRDEVSVEPVDAVDHARRLGRVSWEPTDATFLTDDRAELLNAFDRGALGTAATLVGLAQRMLDITVAYAAEREQFGAPIGSFQAVKHNLADAAKALTFARPAVYRVSWSLAVGQRTDQRDVSIAKALASDAALQVGRAALQCHGAIGYTVEHDLHLYLKRTWALARAWGDSAWHRDQIGHALGI